MFNLVALMQFGEYAQGDIISDVDEIAKILADERAAFVNKIPAVETAAKEKPSK